MPVDNTVIFKLQSVDEHKSIREAQLLTDVQLAAVKIECLMKFNVTKLKDAIPRFVL